MELTNLDRQHNKDIETYAHEEEIQAFGYDFQFSSN